MTGLGAFPYAAIALAAAVEGEVVFVGAAALVAAGVLHPLGVLLSGATGAALGDQVFFFVVQANASRWLDARLRGQPHAWTLLAWVRRYQTLTAAAVRFAPGLRITLTALCAAAGMPAWRFCAVNALTAVLWATVVMAAVAYGGPELLTRTGLTPRLAVVGSAALVLLWVALSPRLALRLMGGGAGPAADEAP